MLSIELKDLYDFTIKKIDNNTSQFKLTILEIIRQKYLNNDDYD